MSGAPKIGYAKIGLSVWLVVACAALSWASQIRVCANCSHATISAAIQAAAPHDTLLVSPGEYFESEIVIDKPLTILGIDYPVIDGGGDKEIFLIFSDSVEMQGLQVQNVVANYVKDNAAIRVKKVHDVVLRNNRVLNSFFGIYLEHCRSVRIEGNEVRGEAEAEMSSGNAIHLWYCKDIQVENNLVRRHRDGIYLEFVENSHVTGNISEDNIRYGLHFMFSDYDAYRDNIFQRNGAGVAVMFSKHIEMMDNTFVENWGPSSYGLLLKEIYDAEIEGNDFTRNCIAIFVEGSSRINYRQNDFNNNGWALKISGGCLDNKITGNNFIANAFDISMGGNDNNNLIEGNYWSDYRGYDLDHDDIGDVHYRPVKLFNYVVNQTPESIVLLRSLFVDIVNFSEKVNPIFTPKHVMDQRPLMNKIQRP